jgi:transposase
VNNIKLVGIDLAKMVFQLHGLNDKNRVVLRKRLHRDQLLPFIAQLPSCRIVMEACGSAHYWARQIQALGHTVQLIAPQHVKRFVRGNKNDRHDAAAICQAAQQDKMVYVAIKTIEQQDILALHRVRESAMKQRTALNNQLRSLLAEYGVVFPVGLARLRQHIPETLTSSSSLLTEPAKVLVGDLYEQFCLADQRVKQYDRQIQQRVKENPLCQQLMPQRGIGPLTASAFVASVGHPFVFKNGRHVSAWLGLVPKHRASGPHCRLQGISKRGDRYLRTLLVHGARAVVRYAEHKDDALSRWLMRIKQQKGANVAAVALANKNARQLWAIMAATYQQ